MSDGDRADIIKKVQDAGEGDANPETDDTADLGAAEEDPQPTEENLMHEESGIQILPKDHKQVFVDAKLGVTENTSAKSLEAKEKLSIFGENNYRNLIMQKLYETTDTEAPTVVPEVVPTVKPDDQPTRRQKPWRINPNPDPEPKAEE